MYKKNLFIQFSRCDDAFLCNFEMERNIFYIIYIDSSVRSNELGKRLANTKKTKDVISNFLQMLAVVYETFTGIEKDKFRKLLLHKRKACQLAFRLLVSKQNPNTIRFKQFQGLMRYYSPRISKIQKKKNFLT